MKASRFVAATALAASAVAVVACGGSSSAAGGSNSSGSGSAKPVAIRSSPAVGQTHGPAGQPATPIGALHLSPAEIAQVKQGNYTVALVWHQSSDFTTAVTNGAEAEFKALGIRTVAITQANFDPGVQKTDIETVMAKKPSLMLSLPVDPVATASAYRSAVQAGTKLVLLSNVPQGFVQGKDYVSVVTDDLFQMGKDAADALAASIGDQGKIAYFYHAAKYYVTNQRDQAFKATIQANYPKIKIVAQQGIANPNNAESQASATLTQNPDLNGAYVTFSQPVGEGVLSALRNGTNQNAKMVSLDLDQPLALAMARGGNVAALVADKAYALGQAMAEVGAYGLLHKPAPPFLVAPALIITRANLTQGYMESLHEPPPAAVAAALKSGS